MKIKEYRTARSLTQQQLAEKIGVTRVAVSQFETGTIQPSRSTLIKLAETFEVDLEELLGLTVVKISSPHQTSTSEFHVVSKYPNPDTDYVEIPFVPNDALGSFAPNCHEPLGGEFERRQIRRVAGERYDNAYLIRIRGNSMAPVYPDGAEYVMRNVPQGNWQYAQGVHALSLRNEMFLIKRIVSNQNGVLVLESDNDKTRMSIELGDILCLWVVEEGVYMPKQR